MGTHREYHLLVVSLPLCETPFLLTNKIKKKVNSLCIKNKVSTFHLYQCTKTKIEKTAKQKTESKQKTLSTPNTHSEKSVLPSPLPDVLLLSHSLW